MANHLAMRALPRALTAIVVGAVLVLSTAPGGAQEDAAGPPPRAEATASALRLNLFGNEVIFSATDTEADSAPFGRATGTGAFLGTMGFGESEAVAQSGTPTAGSPDEVCSDLALPADLPLPLPVPALPGDPPAVVACSSAEASAGDGVSTATATGKAVQLDLGSSEDLEALGLPPLNEIIDPADLDTLDPILDPILGLIPPGTLPFDPELIKAGLGAALAGDVTVLRITSGTTESTSSASGSTASASSTADGLTVDLLVTALGPLATIEIGSSSASATYENGALDSEHTIAPVTITPGVALTASGLPAVPPIPVPPGQTVDIPLPAPLTSRITVADGNDELTDTVARSTAANLRLELFTGLPGGGVTAAVADAAAAVERPPAEEPPVVQPAPEVPRAAPAPARQALPRTGGDGRWVPIGVLLAVAAGVAFVTLRRTRGSVTGA